MNGTIKIGRWTYPAVQAPNGAVTRNTKTNGSGEQVTVPADVAAKFVADVPAAPEQVPAVPGFTPEADASSDYEDLRVAYRFIFDQFAATYPEIAEHLDVELGRAKALVSALVDAGIVVTDKVNEAGQFGKGETVAQSLVTYDNQTVEDAMASFAKAVLPEVKVRRGSNHGGKVGAQTRKPGKSTWAVGDKCPQGHKIEEGTVYRMPSGRNQCRKCRAGYPSNT